MVEGLKQYRIKIAEITEELRPLIDTVMDPLLELNDPPAWYEAYHKVRVLISNDAIWGVIVTVQPGAASNYAIHNLGPDRMTWLRNFRQQITNKAVNE